MLRVKKVSDAIFPRDFSKTMQSYINIFRDDFSRIRNVQISNIIKHYESKLLSIKNRIEEVEYSKKAKEILDLYNKGSWYNQLLCGRSHWGAGGRKKICYE